MLGEMVEAKEEEKDTDFKTSSESASEAVHGYSMEMMTRICRSTGPREILIKLAVNRHLLLLQISAIRIQAMIRRFIARRRFYRIKRHFQLFMSVTEDVSKRLMEEMVLSSSLEVALRALRTAQDYRILSTILKQTLDNILLEILEEVTQEMTYAMVVELVQALSTSYLMLQKFGSRENYLRHQREKEIEEQRQRNPLLSLLFTVSDEVATEFIKPVVIEAVEEEATRYLIENYSHHLLDQLLIAPFFQNEVLQVARNCLDEFSLADTKAAEMVEALHERIAGNRKKEQLDDVRLLALYREKFPPPLPEVKRDGEGASKEENKEEKEVSRRKSSSTSSLSKQIASLFINNLFSSMLSPAR